MFFKKTEALTIIQSLSSSLSFHNKG